MQKESICPVQADIQTAVSSFHVWVSVKYESKQLKNDQFCQAISDVFFYLCESVDGQEGGGVQTDSGRKKVLPGSTWRCRVSENRAAPSGATISACEL